MHCDSTQNVIDAVVICSGLFPYLLRAADALRWDRRDRLSSKTSLCVFREGPHLNFSELLLFEVLHGLSVMAEEYLGSILNNRNRT